MATTGYENKLHKDFSVYCVLSFPYKCFILMASSIFDLDLIKQAPFHSGISRNEDVSNQDFKDSLDNNRHWGNTIRKMFYNSNGVSLIIEEGSNPIIFSLNDPHHDGLCIGTQKSNKKSNILSYTICSAKDIKEAHDNLLPKSFWDGHSEKDLKTMQHLLRYPIWQVEKLLF